MKRKLLIAVPLLSVVVILAWIFRPKREFLGEAYVGERTATLWSSVALVREPLDTLHYGDRVDVVARRNDSIKVRTAGGELGWVEGRYLMDPALWQRSTKLLKQVMPMTMQARGRTKVATNLRVSPGRTQARLYQFGRGVPVEIVARAVADWVQVPDEKDSSNEPPETKKEDWFLIRGLATRPPGESTARAAETTTTQPGDQTLPIAGWVIARFIELDLPDPVRDGASSSNIRSIAWFELNRASDPSGDKPQYLLAAARGPEDIVKRIRIAFDALESYENFDGLLLTNGTDVMYEHHEDWYWPTGESATNRFVTVHRVENGKITLWKDYWDLGTLAGSAPPSWQEDFANADMSWLFDATGLV